MNGKGTSFEQWMDENDFEESTSRGWSIEVFKKNGGVAYKSPDGQEFDALGNKQLWQAGYDQCLKDLADFKSATKAEENGG